MDKLKRLLLLSLIFLIVFSSFSMTGKMNTAAAASEQMPWKIVYEDFEDISDLRVTTSVATTTATLSQVARPEPVMHGIHAAKLNYNFLGANGTAAAYLRFKNQAGQDGRPIAGNPVEIGFWVYGAGNNSWIRGQVAGLDSAGASTNATIDFTTTTTRIDGWKYVSAAIPSSLKSELKLNFIYYVETGLKTSADLYFDQVTLLYQQAPINELDWHNIRDLGVGETLSPKLSIAKKNDSALTYLDPSHYVLTSSHPEVISVDANGQITALSEGEATLIATYNGLSIATTINVVEQPLAASHIVVDGRSSLVPTEQSPLKVFAIYNNEAAVDVTASSALQSSDPTVLTVNQTSMTGVSYGSAELTVTYQTYQKQLTTSHQVVVQPGELQAIKFKDTFSAIVGSPLQAEIVGTYRIEGDKPLTSGVTFTVDNPSVASIDADGLITPLQTGVTTLKATYNNMETQQTFVVTEQHQVLKYDLRGAWISTVENIDWPTKQDYNPTTQRADFINLLDNLEQTGINAVFVQIRPTADSFFPSSYFPWSHWLTGEQGVAPADGYDPLSFMIEEAQKRNMEFHAWINPFRIAMHTNLNNLADGHIAKENPAWTVPYDGKLFFNPGIEEVRQYIINSIEEIVDNYDIDGIHMDDYFYPYPSSTVFADATQYNDYVSGGGTLALEDWRRENVNKVVSGLYAKIKDTKSYVKFGISPFGIWKNANSAASGNDSTGSQTNGLESYSAIYADTRKWIQEGWVDYIAPQLYWEFGLRAAPYATLVDWWTNEVETYATTHDVHLYIGHATYKVGTTNWMDEDQLPAQLRYNQSKDGVVKGSVLFSSSHFLLNPLGLRDKLKAMYATPSIIPVMPWMGGQQPLAVTNETVANTASGIRIAWEDANREDDVAYYAIYRTMASEQVDINNPHQLLAKVRKTASANHTYEDKNVQADQQYNYAITALSRLHIESSPSTTLSLKHEPAPTPTPDPEPTPTPTPDPEPTPTPTPDPEPIPVPNPVPNPVPTPTPTPVPNPNGEDEDETTPVDPSEQFNDISKGHWAYQYITKALLAKIFNGYPDGTIRPNASMSRAEFVTALSRLNIANDSKSSSQVLFQDIAVNAWYAKAVSYFAELQLISGYEDGSFRPNQTITREESFVILYRLLMLNNDIEEHLTSALTFVDADEVSSWAKAAISALVAKGIINGNHLNELNPKEEISRAEFAKIIAILLK